MVTEDESINYIEYVFLSTIFVIAYERDSHPQYSLENTKLRKIKHIYSHSLSLFIYISIFLSLSLGNSDPGTVLTKQRIENTPSGPSPVVLETSLDQLYNIRRTIEIYR